MRSDAVAPVGHRAPHRSLLSTPGQDGQPRPAASRIVPIGLQARAGHRSRSTTAECP